MIALYLEEAAAGQAMAFAPDIPGTYGWGPSRHAALKSLRKDINWKLNWLKEHGLNLDVAGPEQIVESVPATGTASDYDTEGFFSWDAQTYTNQEVDQTRQIITWSRVDLLDLLNQVPPCKWDLRLIKGKRTISENLDHIAIAEWWYTSRVPGLSPARESWHDYPNDPLDKLMDIRIDVLVYLDGMARVEAPYRSRQYVRNGETWSGRKVLRRMTWHEVHHYKLLIDYITQLLK